ncbi:MAG: helix-turn-helix domain-containing protein, partial [Bacteroidota bacterium]
HKQKKFIQYITDLRIDYALEKLANDKKFRAYNIKSIAAELGYNSAESFSKDFKRRTKLYPSYYIKKINET